MLLNRATTRGFTIVELMVSVTISVLILAGLATLFANNSRARNEIDRANQQTENGRYAMQIIGDDLRTAGYLGQFDPTALTAPATKPDPCATDLATLKSAMVLAVQGYDNAATIPTCLSDVKAGTDILVVRRASTCAVGAAGCDPVVANDAYLQVSGCSSATELGSGNILNYYAMDSNLANLTLHQKDCATAAPYYQYRTHIYFIANNDKTGDGVPTLKRWELGAVGGAGTIVPLVEGIDNLQIAYGLDTTAPTSGTAAVFNANPDTYNACVPATCVGYWRNTVAAQVYMLARNTTTTPGYTDGKTYSLGLKADGTANTFGPYNDGYRRHAYDSVMRLNNPAGRNTP